MNGLTQGVWTTIALGLDLGGAIAVTSAALYLWSRRDRLGHAGPAMLAALVLSAVWALVATAATHSGLDSVWASLAESLRNLGWLFVIYRLFEDDGRHASLAPIRPVIVALALVELTHLCIDITLSRLGMASALGAVVFEFNVLFRLLVTVGGLVLVHNLYVGGSRDVRGMLRWPALGLTALWAFDLNLYTVAYLSRDWPYEIASFRGLATILLAIFTGLSVARNRADLRLRPSRTVTFQTFSLLAIGAYLIAMVAVAQWLSYAGGNFARLVELGFLTVASAFALVILPSRHSRAWLRVVLTKHFFQHRYDYREEWLRFTRTIGGSGEDAPPLGERVVRSLADLFESPAGLLLRPADQQDDFTLAARWNWRELVVPAMAMPAQGLRLLEQTGFIVDLDDEREGHTSPVDMRMPEWLLAEQKAWAVIPLVHYEKLVGLVVLARPQLARKFDWEDFDLLRVVGQQVASYLAENASQSALAQAASFEEFHRRIAFVMHDIKNLASQFSLLARNAELHADKPAFRADMLVTLRNSSEKLNALIARLSRYGSGGVERIEPVSMRNAVESAVERFKASGTVSITGPQDMVASANRHSLEQVLVHLVQNAIDAGDAGSPVRVTLFVEGGEACIEVRDFGRGMSPEFVRSQLFAPFVSTKPGGFGIGAFEARELVRAMRGRLDVVSGEGLGSSFTIHLPLAGTFVQPHGDQDQKVA